MTMDPEWFWEVLQASIGRDIWLGLSPLPHGCATARLGGLESDNIMHAKGGKWTTAAVGHTSAHVALLHCGDGRDGTRFACVDPRSREPYIRYQVRTLFGGNEDELPLPLFTRGEQQEAGRTAEVLPKECHWRRARPPWP